MYLDDSHRSGVDIIESILKYIGNKGEAKKTHILYATNLNTRSLEKYLNQLISIHAVEIVKDSDGKVKYSITQYGKDILRVINKLRKILKQKDPIIEASISNGDSTLTDFRIIEGLTGLTYPVFIIAYNKAEYVFINMPDFNEIEEITRDIAYTLLVLTDTEYSCIIYLKSISSKFRKNLVKNVMEKLFSNLNITQSRYLFIE